MGNASVNERFAGILKARLNGRLNPDGAEAPPILSPAQARLSGVPEDMIAAASAETLGLAYSEKLNQFTVSHDFLTRVPIAFARGHALIGMTGEGGVMSVALSDLGEWPQVLSLRKLFGREVRAIFAPREEILRAVNLAYQTQSGQAERVIEELDAEKIMADVQKMNGNEDLLDVASRAPVIKLVNLILLEAVKRRASDVHIHPFEDKLVVRFRIDGVLYDVFEPPAYLHQEVLSRIKVMGAMNIAERRLAQDGRATVEVGDRVVDLRIATLPTTFGERVVIRLLDKSIRLYELAELGMPEKMMEDFRTLICMDHGIILVTGPTGSGKSTTLYATLQELDAKEANIVTLEDPIEYRLPGISQTQVSEKKGMTFSSGLRHVLRQDPDIIMVGEIRDSETARMAIQSALTGHLVFSTLHTNDAAGAVTRLLELGVEPYLVASSVLGVVAQRLVRKICLKCRAPYTPEAAEFRRWGLVNKDAQVGPFFKGAGCEACMRTGYMERLGVFEMLMVTEPIRESILARERSSTIKEQALSSGMTTLRGDGMDKVRAGVTTMNEVASVTGRDEF